jgi:CheY-like chemotaxis protein
MDLESLDFSVRKCVEAAVVSVQPLLTEKGLAVSIQIDGDVPDWVRGDPHRLRQVLLNLLGNAVKFTIAGGIGVRVSLAAEQAAAAGSDGATAPLEIQFAVSDTGIGIPESQRELIFQPFQQADGSVTRRFGGSGLGLAISRKLVAKMGGRMWLESTEGHGSTLFFTVSLAPAKTPAEDQERGVAAVSPAPAEQPPSRPLSILVAEDNVVNQILMRSLLEKRGHRVTVVGNGAAALTAWQKDRFDCILMDIQMPEMDGYEAAHRIRAAESESGAHIPIIALTAYAMKGDREKCLQAGMDSYIAKPIQTGALDAALANVPVHQALATVGTP